MLHPFETASIRCWAQQTLENVNRESSCQLVASLTDVSRHFGFEATGDFESLRRSFFELGLAVARISERCSLICLLFELYAARWVTIGVGRVRSF